MYSRKHKMRELRRIGILHRLYVRIYVALLASLVVAACLFGMAAHGHPDTVSGIDTLAEVAAEILPAATAPPADQQAALMRWQNKVHANLALYAADGTLLAEVGRKLPAPNMETNGSGFMLRHPSVVVLRLPDERLLLGQRSSRHQATMGMAALVAVIALAVALGAFPVVRRLTRRLEALQASVESLGAGKLGTRVDDRGSDEVAGLARSFNEAAARIEQLMLAQKNLLANASHELRSPLARIRMAAELMPEQGADAIRAELNTNIAELDQLIEELLLASRLDASAADTVLREEMDVTGLVAEECARVDAQLHASPLAMKGDARLLRRMVRNLLENAKRHGGGTAVDVTVASTDGMVEIDVADHGPGVPESQRELIFTPFYRMPGASEAAGSVGLGLSLVRQIARKHGGDVQCLPNEDGGCRFRVRLPAA
jgi:signal transduction histidine kinase